MDVEDCVYRLGDLIEPLQYAFISPTNTGLKKSIMDAIIGVRVFLKQNNLHDYDKQLQGPNNKVVLKAFFVKENGFEETEASLYRPVTKKGDPRIWLSGLSHYAAAGNLLMLLTIEGALFVLNLSNKAIWESIKTKGIVYGTLIKAQKQANSVRDELLEELKKISSRGWIKSVTPGDPGVGDTLEHELGIARNNSPLPDYKGIELKATRLSKNGAPRTQTRNTLFSKTPDEGLTYHQILDTYGKVQVPRGATDSRLQLYETFTTKRVNGYDLFLKCNNDEDKVEMLHSSAHLLDDTLVDSVCSWNFYTLQNAFAEKHRETMWIGAESKIVDGVEYFRYVVAQYTSKPNTSALIDLIGKGIVTLDLAAHVKPDGGYRDHGMLWKINPKNRALIVGTVMNVDLTN